MKTIGSGIAAGCLLIFTLGGSTAAQACAMPSDLIVQQSYLNYKYPNATFVTGATWTLQKAGKLAMPDAERIAARGAERAKLDENARLAAIDAIWALSGALEKTTHQHHSISIVLVERMHQERLLPRNGPGYDPLASQPKDDLLVVMTEPALHAITIGGMTFETALALGIVRVYGSKAQQAAFNSDFGQIGARPLAAVSRQSSTTGRPVDLRIGDHSLQN